MWFMILAKNLQESKYHNRINRCIHLVIPWSYSTMNICKKVGTYEIDENVTFNVELDLCMIYTLCCRQYSRQPSRFTKSGEKSVKKPHIILTIRSTTFLRWKILVTSRAQKPMTETAREHPWFQNGHNYLTNISKSPTVIGLLVLTPN
jgi:hypothetical protein